MKQLKLQAEKNRELDKLYFRMDICDAVIHAMMAIYSKKGYKAYKRWFDKIRRRIDMLLNRKVATIWDNMKRKSKKIT